MIPHIVHLRILIKAGPMGDIQLAAYDGLNARLLRFLEKLNGPVKVAVVRNGDRLHTEFFGVIDKIGNLRETIKKRVVGVDMEVDEFHYLIIRNQALLGQLSFIRGL